jgi:hypothetical protein
MEENNGHGLSHVVFLFLIQRYFFYATGHETTFTNIKWESAFHGMYGDTSTTVSHLVMGSLIVVNTYCSTILVCAYVVFADGQSNQVNGRLRAFKSVMKFSILSSIKVIFFYKVSFFF